MSPGSNEEPSLKRLGDYEIIRELGRGGMGVVFEARQVSLNRRVALKVLASELGITPKAVKRFRREAEAAAKLHHTSIVPVYATGEHKGSHFYAMELIEGPSVDHLIDLARANKDVGKPTTAAKPISPPASEDLDLTQPHAPAKSSSSDRGYIGTSSSIGSDTRDIDSMVRMIAEVADALNYAHSQGVIHRDIKPSNLLMSPGGRLSVSDFGLARMLEQPGMTMTGEFVGTPAYMSPEQISAGRTLLDHRTDIYSLGATLYEMLTLRPPFIGERRDQVLAQILHKEPVPPRRLNNKIPIDLETICLKALEKDPDRRYQTAGEMADDLRRYVNRFAISARRAGPIARLKKWGRRHPALAAAVAFAAIAVMMVGFLIYQNRAREIAYRLERRQTTIEKAVVEAMSGNIEAAKKATREAELLGASPGWVRLLHGQLALNQGQIGDALENLEQAARLMPENVAAHAMLVIARFHTGQFELAVDALEKLERLESVTHEDFIFKGYAQSLEHPTVGLATLDEAIQRRKSPLAFMMRAQARAFAAWDTGHSSLAEQAVEDANLAQAMLEDNPYAISTGFQAHVLAAVCFRRHGDLPKYKEHVAHSNRYLEQFEPFRDREFLQESMSWYLHLVADTEVDEAVVEQWRSAAEGGSPFFVIRYISSLFGRGETNNALFWWGPVSESEQGTWLEVCRVYLIAEAEGQPAAEKALADLIRHTQGESRPYFPAIFYPSIPRLLSNNAAADDLCRELRKTMRPHPVRREFTQANLDYNCGLIDDRKLLDTASGSYFSECEAHFQIALRRLADGDRETAREHFQRSVDSGLFPFFEYQWSRAFLSRLDCSPQWPTWSQVEAAEKGRSGIPNGP